MIYSPAHFQCKDKEKIFNFIQKNLFASIISCSEQSISNLSKIPLMLKKDGDKYFLEGHFARQNPHWKEMIEYPNCIVIFEGPHGYISPTWYQNPSKSVPTWNYAVVTIKGKAKIIDSAEWLQTSVLELSEVFEENEIWKKSLDKSYFENLSKGIIGVKIQIEEFQSKFKLSQNRSHEDRKSIVERLSKSNPHLSEIMEASL